jgi:hypothetical protein
MIASAPWRSRPPLDSRARAIGACGVLLLVAALACGGDEPNGADDPSEDATVATATDAPAADGAETPAGEGGPDGAEAPAGEGDPDGAAGDTPLDAAGEPAEPDEPEEPPPSFTSEKNRRRVTLFFQEQDGDLLGPERRRIFLTASIVDQAKQIVGELIEGPRSALLLPTMPRRTRLLGLYLDRHGTAYVDLSRELIAGHSGGTSEELATVFSLVNSLTYNLPEIKRVQILVDGEQRETLKSHLDLQRSFVQDMSIVRVGGR